MELKKLPYHLTVCKVADTKDIDLAAEFYFIGKTDEELSLVCRTEDTPLSTADREDGWRGIRIQGGFFPRRHSVKVVWYPRGESDRYLCCFYIQYGLHTCQG